MTDDGYPMMPITALYAALLTPIFVMLSVRVIGERRSGRVAVGDGGNPALLRRIRVHANFAEYVPLALVLMALAESVQTPNWLLHTLGLLLLAGRASHAVGMSREAERFQFRVAGVAATFAVLITAAVLCVVGAVRSGALF
jgi:uncharacterized membrane protein YecN with MAPEG domain